MIKQLKNSVSRFLFCNMVIACALLLSWGCLTVSERTAYNMSLREYASVRVTATASKINVSGSEGELSLTPPSLSGSRELWKLLKLTPAAPAIYLAQELYGLFESSGQVQE